METYEQRDSLSRAPEIDSDLLMEAIPDGLIVLDAGCRIHKWNRAMEKLTGYAADEAVGQPCSFLGCRDMGTGARIDLEQQCLLAQGARNRTVEQTECTVRSKSGEDIPVVKNGQVLRDRQGRSTGFVETLTDLRPLKKLEQDLAILRHDSLPVHGLGRLIGSNRKMLDVYDRIRLAGDSEVTVLIEGETGTGKELVAEAIHAMSARKDRLLIKVNCSALSENLLESELFGHVKGAFTGAVKDKVGRIEMAEGGTLLLDEIGDVSPLIQLKLLRVLQEHEYERVGESQPRKADVRFIAATHRNLRQRVAEGAFREDFYYRIRVFSIAVPPLREHKEDIPLLCETFVKKLNASTGKRITHLSHSANHCLMDYCWPGNVRELENAIEHAFVTCRADTIELDDLPVEMRTASQREIECRERGTDALLPRASGPLTKEALLQTLAACNGNQSETARRLGVDRTTVWRKMKQWKIRPPVGN